MTTQMTNDELITKLEWELPFDALSAYFFAAPMLPAATCFSVLLRAMTK